MTTTSTQVAPAPATGTGVKPRRRLVHAAQASAGLLGFALAWEVLARAGALPPELPPPTEILVASFGEFASPALWVGTARTLQTWALAMLLSMLVIPIGVALGISATAFRASWFVVEFCRTIPPVVILPLAVLQFGVTMQMSLLVVVFSGAWTILYNTIYGARDVDPVATQTAKVYGISPMRRLTHVILPTAAPFIATGVRIASAGALLLTILTELIGGAPGVGQSIVEAQQAGAYAPMFALIIFTGLLGLALNYLIVALESKVLAWHPAYRGGSK